MSGRAGTRKRVGNQTSAQQPKRTRSATVTSETSREIEILSLSDGTPNPDSSESATGTSQEGNPMQRALPTRTNTEPTLANFIDFEKILSESDISLQTPTKQSECISNDPHVLEMSDNSISLPNFTFGEETLRLGVEDMSSHVPAQLCRKIWSHQYVNIALLLKGNVELQDICSGGILHITDKGQLETRPKVTRDKVNNIVKWTDAFLIFSSIYLKKFPNKAQELLQYMSIIRDAAARSSSLSWRTYDEQFRIRQATKVQPWGKLNSDLWLRVMTSSGTSFPSEVTNPNIGTCFDFNNGFCSWNSCKFTHACSHCGGINHGRQTCFKLSNVNRGGSHFRRSRGYQPYARGGRPFTRRGNKQ